MGLIITCIIIQSVFCCTMLIVVECVWSNEDPIKLKKTAREIYITADVKIGGKVHRSKPLYFTYMLYQEYDDNVVPKINLIILWFLDHDAWVSVLGMI